jgi:putative peptidoglycan lipid II flippase
MTRGAAGAGGYDVTATSVEGDKTTSVDDRASTGAEKGEHRRIAKRAGIVAAGTLASRLLGLVRDQTMAAIFPRAVTDAFFVAFTIPNVLRQLLGEGAVQNAVLPVLVKLKEQRGEDEARRFFRAVRGLSLVALVAVTALGVGFAPAVVTLFAGGYANIAGELERTVLLTRWVFPYILCMGTAALGAAALNTHQRFIATSFAPGLLNVAFIVLALALPHTLGARGYEPGLALAAGALLGGVLQVIAQWPSLRAIGYLEAPSFDFGHPGVRDVGRRMAPLLLGMGVYYVDVVLARRFLSELGLGAQSYFSWAMRLCDFPQGIFVMALQAAALPSLARLAARGDRAELGRTFAFGMRLALFVAIPATALFVGLAEPLVVLLFQRGEFDHDSARHTAAALVAQGSGVWLVAAVRQLLSVYYAVGDTRTPVYVAATDLVAFILLALGLRGPLGHVGVGWAVTGSSAVQAALLWLLLARKVPSIVGQGVLPSVLRVLGASAAAVVAGRFVAGLLDAGPRAGALSRALPGLFGATAFGVTFLVVAFVLRSPELMTLRDEVRRRLARTRGGGASS